MQASGHHVPLTVVGRIRVTRSSVRRHYRGAKAGQGFRVKPGIFHVIARHAHPPQWAVELDSWVDLAFAAVCVGALIGLLSNAYGLLRARWQYQGIDGAVERARERYRIRRS